MLRRFTVLAALLVLLTGCVTTREVVYRDRYYDADGYVRSYDREAYRDGSYYAPALSGRGDYYYGRTHYGWDDGWYWDYPAYYSVFWPLYHRWYDPFYFPGYYYGVTYYPRHYFSIGFHGGWGWARTPHFYSPYRYSWVDNYYDWTPWYRHSHRHERPRYGSARNEAERLARMGDFRRGHGAAYAGASAGAPFGRYGATRGDVRRADYSGVPAPRQDPGVRGFGVREDGPRRVGAYGREAPVSAGFGAPAAGAARGGWSAERAPSAAQQELGRWDRAAPARGGTRYERATRGGEFVEPLPGPRDYRRSRADYGEAAAPRGGFGESAPAYDVRREAAYAPRREARYEAAPSPQYAPRHEARPAPQFESRYEARPAPQFEARPEPRSESRGESGWSGGGRSGGESRGEVRRVGSNREE